MRTIVVILLSAICGCRSGQTVKVLDQANIDTTCSPCEDFYQYANGGWLSRNPVPGDRSRWGSFDELRDANNDLLKRLLEEVADRRDVREGSDMAKVKDFYLSGMDTATVEAQSGQPLADDLGRIQDIDSKEALVATLAHFHAYPMEPAFRFAVEPDARNSTMTIAVLSQGGLGLPDRDYYTRTEFKDKQTQDEYINHITKMLYLIGEDASTAEGHARTVMAIETRLAGASMTREQLRKPDSIYHKMTLSELQRLTPRFPWSVYFRSLAIDSLEAVNVAQPAFFRELDAMMADVSLDDWKVYLRWHLIRTAAPYLSSSFVNLNFLFYGTTLNGTKELQPRWRRVATALDEFMGEALGQLYVEKVFPRTAKERARRMVDQLIAAYHERIDRLTWMSDSTRRRAHDKLNAIRIKIGYPDEWRDYSGLTIQRDHYFNNVRRASAFEFKRNLAKLGKPVDPSEWFMSPPTVNAYYNPQTNEIAFPAGILQWPFFSMDGDEAFNYGAMGAVIGHELTHGFDDEGRQYDADGNLKNWWSVADQEKFMEKAKALGEQFGAYKVLDLYVNPNLTMGENIADLGGLMIAYDAYRKATADKPTAPIDGWTGDQRFFLAWAQIWRQNIRDEAARLRIQTDPHAPGQYRVNGPLSNMEPFAKAFGCKPGDPMVRPDSVRVIIW